MSEWRGLLDQLVRSRGHALFGFAYMLTGSRDEAEDLLQDALVRSFRTARRVQSLDAAHIYVKRAISTAFIDRARRASVRPRTVGADSDLGEWVWTVASSPDHAARVNDAMDLQAALLRLAPRERACVALHYADDLPVGEVADVLGLAPGTVKRYLSDARARLREILPGLDFVDQETVSVDTREEGA